MKNATISISRTRATAGDPLIAYRPLSPEWGEVKALRALRSRKARAVLLRLDAGSSSR